MENEYTRLDVLTVDQAMKFFERCEKEGATTLEARLKVLNRFQHETLVVEASKDDVRNMLSKNMNLADIRLSDQQ